jgi:hypothetical protein
MGMHRIGRLMLGLVVCLTVLGGASAGDDVKLEGGFVWHRSEGNVDGKLKAVFSSTGTNQWDVAFHFKWDDGPHVWRGTAEGNLKTGDLSGEVVSDDDHAAEFLFKGSFVNGEFKGTHGQVSKDGSLRDTGTLSLGPA